MNVLEVLNAAADYLARHGVESPRLNAEHLLAHVLGKKNRIDLYLDFERPLGDAERAPLRDLVRERASGRPLQHLLGSVEFLGRPFACDARALIPRPETEQLVELALGLLSEPAPSLVDVGTGSGIIALTLALEKPSATVAATDSSPAALALARENAARHSLDSRVMFHETDLLAGLTGPFDLVISNPPYIASDELPGLSREVRQDPPSALDGGPDGLDTIRRLAPAAAAVLRPGGFLALELGHDQAERSRKLLAAHNYRDIAAHRDYQGVQRFLIARYG